MMIQDFHEPRVTPAPDLGIWTEGVKPQNRRPSTLLLTGV